MSVSAHQDGMSDERMLVATGRHPSDWFALLDEQNATALTHTAIARWLAANTDASAWWAQAITVRYEQARGMREPGQKADGTFSAVSTRSVSGTTAEVLRRAIGVVSQVRGEGPASENPEARTPSARWKLAGRERLVLTVTPVREGTVSVGFTHSGMADSRGLGPSKEMLAGLLGKISADS